jgi:hypothetical protein
MSKPDVFYSFHFDNDVMRVQMIRNMGVVTGDEPVDKNVWETLKKTDSSVEAWIEKNMKDKDVVIVLIGAATAGRKWIKYEMKRAWELNKPIFGIHIHNIKSMNEGTSTKGSNPFDAYNFSHNGVVIKPLVYDPKSSDAYNDIKDNIGSWIAAAKRQRT